MGTSQQWCEYNGATPTESNGGTYAPDCYWKSVDDCTSHGGTAYTAAPVPAVSPHLPFVPLPAPSDPEPEPLPSASPQAEPRVFQEGPHAAQSSV